MLRPPIVYLHLFLASFLALMLLSSCGGESSPAQLTDRDFIKKAEALSEEKRYQDAVLVLKQALRANPKNTEARWMLGLTYLELGNALSAEKELLRARELGLVWHELVVPMSRAWLWAGKPQRVLDELHDLSVFPAHLHSLLWVLVARAQSQLGNIDGAFQALRNAKSFGKEFVELTRFESKLVLQQQYVVLAGNLARAGLEKWPGDRELERIQARIWFSEGQYKEAGSAFFRLGGKQEANPTFRREAIYWSAFSMLLAADLEAYEVVKHRLRAEFPQDKRLGFLEGIELMAQGDLQRSESFLSAYLQDVPEDYVAVYLLGLNHLAQENWQQALDYLNRYSQRFAFLLEARRMEAIARKRLGQQNHSDDVLVDLVFRSQYLDAKEPDVLLMLMSNTLDQMAESKQEFLLRYDAFGRKGFALPRQANDAPGFTRWVAAATHVSEVRYPGILARFRSSVGQGADVEEFQALYDAIQMRDFEAAITLLATKIKQDAPSQEVRMIQALLSLEQGQVKEARDQLSHLYEEDQADPALALFFATVLVDANDQAKALGVLEKAQARAPLNWPLRRALIALYLMRGQPSEAFRLIASAKNLGSEYALSLGRYFLLAGDLASARHELSDAGALADGKDDAGTLRLKAMLGDWEVVKSGLKNIAENHPDQWNSADLLIVRGALAQHEKDYMAAIKVWLELVERMPDDNDLKVTLIELYRQSGDRAQALQLARALQRSEMHLARGHILSGDILVEMGDYRSAAMAYQSAYNMEATRTTVEKRYEAQVLVPDWYSAVDGLLEWLDWHQEDDGIRRLLIDAQYHSGNRAAAIRTADRWMMQNSADAALLKQMIAWVGRESPARSRQLIEQGYKKYPQDPVFLEHKLALLEETEEWPEMMAAIERFRAAHGESSRWDWWQAKVLVGQGELERAEKVLKTLLSKEQAGEWVESARKLLKETVQQNKE